jgi:PknH-like extracellular domain
MQLLWSRGGTKPIARRLRTELQPPIVIKNNGDRYQETPFDLAQAPATLLDHVFTCRAVGISRHAVVAHGWDREEEQMRQPTAAIAIAVISVLVSGCAVTRGNAESTTPTRSMIPRPLVERELVELLLSPEQVDVAMGATGMTVTNIQTAMSDNSATMTPQECLAVDGAAEAPVYSDSGYWAERDQSLNNGDDFTHYLKQAVVLFPTVERAAAFFDASAQQWSACRQYTHTQSESQWLVGQISNAHGTLGAIATQQNAAAPGWACGRALALRNNIIIDINTCSANPADSALKIADQIGTNVTARW